jgi:uncharacterized repeat protein (TIGR03803 family)
MRSALVFGLAAALLTTMLSSVALATPALQVLYSFSGGSDGANPSSALILDRFGDTYGTTGRGGDTSGQGCSNFRGCGVVFEVDSTGHETILHTFVGSPGDGEDPEAGLIRDRSGNLYGTTVAGGATNSGVVFKITPRGIEKILYSFCPHFPSCLDGRSPYSGLILDADGNLYGTTADGGLDRPNCGGTLTYGCGVLFKLTSSGHEIVIHRFLGEPNDGMGPFDAPIQDSAGNFYGTTRYGGMTSVWCQSPNWGCGTIFKIASAGAETILHKFCCGGGGQGVDGIYPFSKLTTNSAGDLFGTTSEGGDDNDGVIFKFSSNGVESIVHSLSYFDGVTPRDLIRDGQGNLYGMTAQGALNTYGAVFEVSRSGLFTVLYNFTGSDGNSGFASLVRDAAGNLYGTTQQGGAFARGVVFKLSP